MNDEILTKYHKIVKIPKANQDEYVPNNSKVIKAFRKFRDEKYKLLFKLLAFSGIRLRGSLHLLRTFDPNKLITNEKIAKYPLGLDRICKICP
jgi:intergrase/recombinase